jgi:hypothetical protein
MSKKTFDVLFRKDKTTLERAANRYVDLDYDYPKLYKKVKKYFENQEGVVFYNEPDADYEVILSLISEKLQLDVPA